MDDKTTIYHILVFVYHGFSIFDGMVHISHDSQFQGFICAYLLKPQLLSFLKATEVVKHQSLMMIVNGSGSCACVRIENSVGEMVVACSYIASTDLNMRVATG